MSIVAHLRRELCPARNPRVGQLSALGLELLRSGEEAFEGGGGRVEEARVLTCYRQVGREEGERSGRARSRFGQGRGWRPVCPCRERPLCRRGRDSR